MPTWVAVFAIALVWYFNQPGADLRVAFYNVEVAILGSDIVDVEQPLNETTVSHWTWSPKDNKPVVLRVDFTSISKNPLNVYVLTEPNYNLMTAKKEFSRSACLSRENVTEYLCSAKFDAGGAPIHVAVTYPASPGIGQGTYQATTFKLKVSAF